MGAELGAALGATEGEAEGIDESTAEGMSDGAADGTLDRAADGMLEGADDGISDGMLEGAVDGGADDGLKLGESEGMALGLKQMIPRHSKPFSVVRPSRMEQKRSRRVKSLPLSYSSLSLSSIFMLMLIDMVVGINIVSSSSNTPKKAVFIVQ